MITPAPIPPLADGESHKSFSKEQGAPRLQGSAGQVAHLRTPSQALCSFSPSLWTAGSCDLSHSYLEKCDLLPDGVEEKKSS